MAGKITSNFRQHLSEQFFEQFSEDAPTNIYLFIARSESWPSDTTPPDVVDSIEVTDYGLWNDMLAMKRISPNSVSYAANRYDWVPNTIYSNYQSNTEISNSNFYVITDEYKYYKCLSNNMGQESTVKPTGTSVSSFTTSDGYVWKYMGELAASEAVAFLTTTHFPVKTLTANNGSQQWNVQQAAVSGSINSVLVSSVGTSYDYHAGTVVSANSSYITIESGASATDNKYNNSSIYINSGVGAGQLRKIIDYVGSTKTARVTPAFSTIPSSSSTYIVSPTISITGDGTGASAYATISGGTLIKTNVINPGANYTFASATVSANSGSGAIIDPQIAPLKGHGADVVNEFYAHNILMNVKLTGNEANTFITNNDYRIIGLVADPLLDDSGTVAGGTSYNLTHTFSVASATGAFLVDETLSGGTSGATAKVAQYNSNNSILVTGINGTFQLGEVLTGSISTSTGTLSNMIAPDIRKYSGKILYYENRTPIVRSTTQTENIKIVIRF